MSAGSEQPEMKQPAAIRVREKRSAVCKWASLEVEVIEVLVFKVLNSEIKGIVKGCKLPSHRGLLI